MRLSTQTSQTLPIIGQGYVRLHPAIAEVDAAWKVNKVDNYEAKVAQINSGVSPVEDSSDARSQDDSLKGAYKASSNFAEVSHTLTIVICDAKGNLTSTIKFL